MQGLEAETVLDSKTYNAIISRINLEEANQALK